MDASVTVSVVTHQSARHVDACLASLESQGPCVREVLLADSGSSDGTLECVRARHPRVRVLSLGRNAGYAAAHNRNWAAASGAFLLALNPDVVLGPGYVPRLLECLQADPGLGAAGGRLLSPGPVPRIDSAGIAYGPARARFVDRGRGSSPELYASEEDVLGACGAAALYRGTALDAVEAPGESPFAERLFMYYEDRSISASASNNRSAVTRLVITIRRISLMPPTDPVSSAARSSTTAASRVILSSSPSSQLRL